MADLISYLASFAGRSPKSPPPVEKWNPDHCGEIDLTIRRDGVWIHEGTPIERTEMVRLFASVIRKEGGAYFLVTPAEKLAIKVEDSPFVAVLLRVENRGRDQSLHFTTNVGDEVAAGRDHAISYRESGEGAAPYVHVRAGLDARVARSVLFDLVEIGETRDIDGEEWFGVASSNVFFPFRRAGEVLGEDAPP